MVLEPVLTVRCSQACRDVHRHDAVSGSTVIKVGLEGIDSEYRNAAWARDPTPTGSTMLVGGVDVGS